MYKNSILKMSLYHLFMVLIVIISPVWSVEYDSDAYSKTECTCNSVSSSVCVSTTCKLYYQKTSACFPGSSHVSLPDGSTKSLADVRVGDHVLVSDGTYEPVLDFIHLQRDTQVPYLRITSQNMSKALDISADHLIFLFEKGDEAVFAGELRVGDRLNMVLSNGVIVPDNIINIERVTLTGLYAPLTPSGKIVVDGVLTSNYAAINNHRLAHRTMTIYRFWIRTFGSSVKESYDEQVHAHWLLQTMEKIARLSIIKNVVGNEFFDGMIHASTLI